MKTSNFLSFLLMLGMILSFQAHGANLTYGKVPNFRLISQTGKSFGLKNLKGHIWVADFIYTRCPDECPLLTEKMARLQRKLPGKVDFVSFSVDPAHDTPAVLSRYAKRYHAGPSWTFLTGNSKMIAMVAQKGFHLALFKQGGTPMHSNRFVLVDGNGAIRGYYDSSSQDELRRLANDVKNLTK